MNNLPLKIPKFYNLRLIDFTKCDFVPDLIQNLLNCYKEYAFCLNYYGEPKVLLKNKRLNAIALKKHILFQ